MLYVHKPWNYITLHNSWLVVCLAAESVLIRSSPVLTASSQALLGGNGKQLMSSAVLVGNAHVLDVCVDVCGRQYCMQAITKRAHVQPAGGAE